MTCTKIVHVLYHFIFARIKMYFLMSFGLCSLFLRFSWSSILSACVFKEILKEFMFL